MMIPWLREPKSQSSRKTGGYIAIVVCIFAIIVAFFSGQMYRNSNRSQSDFDKKYNNMKENSRARVDFVESRQSALDRMLLFQLASRGQKVAFFNTLAKFKGKASQKYIHNILVNHASQQTILHSLVRGQFSALNAGANEDVVRNFDDILFFLLKSKFVDASLYCPLVDVVHYRLATARSALLIHLLNTPKQLRKCLTELDTNGENVLHIASKSKASGFARYFLTESTSRRNDESLNVSSTLIKSSKQDEKELSFNVLNHAATVGSADLVELLRAGDKIGLGSKWHMHRSYGCLEAPLLSACRAGRDAVVEIFLRKIFRKSHNNLNQSIVEGHWNMTCAHLAAARGHTSVLWLLLKHYRHVHSLGLRMVEKDAFGRSAADVACSAGRLRAAHFFIENELIGYEDCIKRASEPGLQRSAEDIALFSCLLSELNQVSESIESVDMIKISHFCIKKVKVPRGRLCRDPLSRYYGESSPSNEGKWRTRTKLPSKSKRFQHCALAYAAMLPRVNINETEFLRSFFSLRRPVIMYGLKNGPLFWPARDSWQKKQFLKDHGDFVVTTSVIPYASLYGGKEQRKKLRSFVESWNMSNESRMDSIDYVFQGSDLFDGLGLQDDMHTPDILKSITEGHAYLRQFSIGPHGSGAQFHFHGDAWNGLVFGTKQWVFRKNPFGTFSVSSSAASSMRELHEEYETEFDSIVAGRELAIGIQQEGDVIFVPEMMSHSTINLGDSLSVAIEGY